MSESYVVTRAGYERMRARLKQIKEFDRPQNVADIETALAHGDLRENAEYHAAKERQGFLDGEMRGIEDKMSRAQIFDPATLSGSKIVFGATVTLLNIETDEEVVYQIVGEDEADLKDGTISYKAPIAQAIIGREEGDEVEFKAPGGLKRFEIVEVEYK